MNEKTPTNNNTAGERHAERACFPDPRPLTPDPSRSAFTLVEMLIVIAIIAILAAAMAYAVGGAQESAKVAKTRAIIAKLHSLVMQKYESYRHRRLPIAIPPMVFDPVSRSVIATPPRAIAQVRCDAMRQLMRMEMPDRWTDVTDNPKAITVRDPAHPGGYFDADPSKRGTLAQVVMQRPAASQAYLTLYNSVANTSAFQRHFADNQGAKCLYLLVTMGPDDADVLENFSESDIGDFDHTGCKEFLDAWGNPIRFLRWAPGFISPLQPEPPGSGSDGADQRMRDQSDPTGIYGSPQPGSVGRGGVGRIAHNTFALYPLIYSAGPDNNYDVVSDSSNGRFSYANDNGNNGGSPNNPFASVSDTADFSDGPIGWPAVFPMTDRGLNPPATSRALGNSDNITNHDIGAK
jgi:prepilin-type N-terminal cleavage/methylation domain-containing protein